MTRKLPLDRFRKSLLWRRIAVLCLGTAALVGLNVFLICGTLGLTRSELARYDRFEAAITAGVSREDALRDPGSVSLSDRMGPDLLGSDLLGDKSLLFFVATMATGSLGLVILMAFFGHSLRREGQIFADLQRLRRGYALCAHVRDLALDQSPNPLAVIDAQGKPVIRNAAFDALVPGLVEALTQKLALPPLIPKRRPDGDGDGDRTSRQADPEESTLIWTSPAGDGHRLYIQRWFLGGDRTFSLIALDDPWHPARFDAASWDGGAGDPSFGEDPVPVREMDLDANEALARALHALLPRIDLTGADIRAHVLPMVHGVPTDVEALFRTLVEAALYSEGSGRSLRIDISAHVTDGIATISIEDNATGTQAWDLPETLYGCPLVVDATPGVGTRICFDLPVARPTLPGLTPLGDAPLGEAGRDSA